MGLLLKEVVSRRDLRRFIRLPAMLHRDHLNWLPPVYSDDRAFFNPGRNRAFSHCDTVMYLAVSDGVPVGRIMGIVNHMYNGLHGIRTGRFGFLECPDDPGVSGLLIRSTEEWARARGMDRIIGPYGFSDKDPQGLMIEGFEHPPVIAAPCNEPYLVKLVEREGYTKEVDCNMFLYPLDKDLPASYEAIARRAAGNPLLRMVEPRTKRELKSLVIPILRLVNETYAEIYGFLPLDDNEMKELAARYMPVIDPRFVKIITFKGNVVAFVLGLPCLTEGIIKSRGHLFPFGFVHLLRAARTATKLDMMLGGIHPHYRGRGLEVWMGMKLFESARSRGMKHAEVHLVLETNVPMNVEMKRIGAVPHKKFRIFQKSLL